MKKIITFCVLGLVITSTTLQARIKNWGQVEDFHTRFWYIKNNTKPNDQPVIKVTQSGEKGKNFEDIKINVGESDCVSLEDGVEVKPGETFRLHYSAWKDGRKNKSEGDGYLYLLIEDQNEKKSISTLKLYYKQAWSPQIKISVDNNILSNKGQWDCSLQSYKGIGSKGVFTIPTMNNDIGNIWYGGTDKTIGPLQQMTLCNIHDDNEGMLRSWQVLRKNSKKIPYIYKTYRPGRDEGVSDLTYMPSPELGISPCLYEVGLIIE